MLPGPERNTVFRQQRHHIAVVHADKIKGQQAGVLAAERTKARAFRQCVFRQRRQPAAPVFGLFNIDIGQPFQRSAQADDPGDVRRPRFQFPGAL